MLDKAHITRYRIRILYTNEGARAHKALRSREKQAQSIVLQLREAHKSFMYFFAGLIV